MGRVVKEEVTVELVRHLTVEQIDALLSDLKNNWIPDLESRMRHRNQYGLPEKSGSIAYKVNKKLVENLYRILPGIYCDIITWGETSFVMCDINDLNKGINRLVRTLNKARKEKVEGI